MKIVEHTQIYFANQPDKPFVNVTRNYIVNGVDVWLECDYDFIRDAFFNLSYTAMFCIPKTSGNHIIWNFTNVELSGNVFFENVHFADSLLTLSYRITKHFSPGVKEPK